MGLDISIRGITCLLCCFLVYIAKGGAQTVTINPQNSTVCQGATVPLTTTIGGFTAPVSYQWSPATGLSCTNCSNPQATINQDITYTVTVSDNTGASVSDQSSFTVDLQAQLNANFTRCFLSGQVGGDTFNLSVNGITPTPNDQFYIINWGDGAIDTITNASSPFGHQYTSENVYNLIFTVVGNNGCRYTETIEVTNVTVPGGNVIPVNSTQFCIPNNFKAPISGTSNNFFLTTYTVDFGDGTDTAFSHPPPDTISHNYISTSCPGNFVVSFNASTGGCNSLGAFFNIEALQPPIADFELGSKTVCVGSNPQFINRTQSGFIRGCLPDFGTAKWDFGDGTTSTVVTPTHTYASPGTYIVSLEVKGTLCDSTTIHYDTICVQNPITPSFSLINSSGCAPLTVTTNNTSSLNTCGGDGFQWRLNGGSLITATNTSFTINTAGQHIIQLISNNACGSITISDTVNLSSPPTVEIDTTNLPDLCESGTILPLLNFDNGGDAATSISWSFPTGNPSSSMLQNPGPISYTTTGAKTISVTASNVCGSDMDRFTFDIFPQPNLALNRAIDSICLGDTATFFASGAANYSWSPAIGLNTTVGNTIKASPSNSQTYQLIGTSGVGCTDTTTIDVDVFPLPTVDAGIDLTLCVDSTAFTLSGQSPPNGIWSGPGIVSANGVFDPQQAGVGVHTINYSVTSAGLINCSNSDSRIITVEAIPKAAFTADSTCFGQLTRFTDVSTGTGINSWNWDFGDMSTSSGSPTSSNTYATVDTFDVRLQVRTITGCEADTVQKVIITPIPTAAFSVSGVDCVGDTIQFTSNSMGGPDQLTWNFGDGTIISGNDTLVKHAYANPGTYTVTLNAGFSINGCSDQDAVNVVIKPKPVPLFSVSNACQNDSVTFTDQTTGTINSRLWDFGDTNSQTVANPKHFYQDTGSYTVRLTVTNNLGCSASDSQVVRVFPPPDPAFTFDTVCFQEPTTFSAINTTAGNWQWNFNGFALSGTNFNPSHTFSSSGTLPVALKISNGFGCIDSLTQNVVVHPKPVADFSANMACFGDSTFFNNNSSGEDSWNWDFGDAAGTSNSENPVYRYTNPLAFDPLNDSLFYPSRLIVTSGLGCKDTLNKAIVVLPRPQASFGFNTACADSPVSFSDSSLGTVSTWKWYFGDGDSSAMPSPRHVYGNGGTFNAQLLISNQEGCADTSSQLVSVLDRPIADFVAPSVCYLDSTVFTNTSSSTASIALYQWNFGDNNGSDSIHPVYTYSSPGSYNVSLQVIDTNNCDSTFIQTVFIHPNPVAAYLVDTVCNGQATTFSDQTVISSGSIANHFWDFGDGFTATSGVSVVHLYDTSGSYPTQLIVTSDSGCVDSAQQSVIVITALIADAAIPTDACEGELISFQENTTLLNGSISNYFWDFGDNNTSTQSNPTHRYSSAGTYQVQLVVVNSSACRDSIQQNITIHPKPFAAFSSDTVCEGNPTAFLNLSTGVGPLSYSWDYGDNTTSSVQNPFYNYASDGLYNARLIINTFFGCADTANQVVTVASQPDVDYAINPACVGDQSTFTDLTVNTIGNIQSWRWLFGDGDSSLNGPNVNHTYRAGGSYITSLSITNSFNCTESFSKTIQISQGVMADMIFTDTLCEGELNLFRDASTTNGMIVEQYWDFGDGTTSSSIDPAHRYTVAGSYPLVHAVETDSGCTDTIRQLVQVNHLPQADFNWGTSCEEAPVVFNNTSTVQADILQTFDWQFGDGNNSDVSDPSHQYATTGTYPVDLIVYSSFGCQASVRKAITIYSQPNADFSYIDTCFSAQFTDQSFVTDGDIVQWAWDFDDGTQGDEAIEIHSFAINRDTFNVRLLVTSSLGCQDTLIRRIPIHPILEINAGIEGLARGCEDLIVQFYDSTIVPSDSIRSWFWDFGDGSSSTLQNPVHTFINAGNYNVQLSITTDRENCEETVVLGQTVEVIALPTADFSFSPEAPTARDPLIEFIDRSSADVNEWWWSFGSPNMDSSIIQNPLYQYPKDTGRYEVTLRVNTGIDECRDTITKLVIIEPFDYIEIPNAFTPTMNPNGGVYDPKSENNDIFFPYTEYVVGYSMEIYDKWGNKVFRTDDLGIGWDGSCGSQLCPQSTYVYKIYVEFATGRSDVFVGDVTLFRR